MNNGVIGTPGGMSAWARLSRQGGVVDLGSQVSLEEAHELQRRVKELEQQLEESEGNYADIHKAWTDASAYYSRIEQEVQTAHENYIKEKDAFDMSLKESKETIQKLEESLEMSISDADRLTRIVSNYEKELFKLKKEGSKVSELERKVSELEHSLRESQEEGKERLAMCETMEDEANKMIAHAEEALGNIIREKEGLEEREKEIAAEKKACEDWAKELRAREKALDKEKKTSPRTEKKDVADTVIIGVESPKRMSKRKAAASTRDKVTTEEDTTTKKEDTTTKKEDTSTKKEKKKEMRPARAQVKKKAQSPQPAEKKTVSSRTKNTATKASIKNKSTNSSSRAATKKAPSVQKTTLTKKKKTTTTKEDTASETTSTRTRSGRTVKRKTFADEE